jgi:hypothetical protein
MNNHLKLIIYIAMIVAIFLFVQDRFDIFDISFKDETGETLDEGDINEEQVYMETSKEDYIEIQIPNGLAVRVDVEIADNDSERSRGLSGRQYLGDYEGMLFIYQNEVNNPFWMKDMLIPLDIIFIDSDNYIVDIQKNRQPCSNDYCPSIAPNEMYIYVLEVNAGFCEENEIEEGYRMVQYLQ